MTSIPPPQGLTESDYETIEAAVTETVRGRWFLSEFARRNRAGEMRLVLEAMERLEASVTTNQTALPSADPSVRLLIQRIKEVAGHLDELATDMRDAGVEARFFEAVDRQGRAVASMMRGNQPVKQPPVPKPVEAPKPAPRMPRADLPSNLTASQPAKDVMPADPRLAALSGLDSLALADKLALFS